MVHLRGGGSKNEKKLSKLSEHSLLEALVDRVEFSLVDGESTLEDLEAGELAARCGGVSLVIAQVREAFLVIQDDLHETFGSLKEEFINLKADNEALRTRVTLLVRAIANEGAAQSENARRRISEPKCFKGVRDAKEIENFLGQMENYFKVAKVEVEARIDTATMYLVDDAMLWWRRRHGDV